MIMITVRRSVTGEALFFVSENDHKNFAFFYLLSKSDPPVWAVSGHHKPLVANVMDFSSYDDALAYIAAHAPSKMPG